MFDSFAGTSYSDRLKRVQDSRTFTSLNFSSTAGGSRRHAEELFTVKKPFAALIRTGNADRNDFVCLAVLMCEAIYVVKDDGTKEKVFSCDLKDKQTNHVIDAEIMLLDSKYDHLVWRRNEQTSRGQSDVKMITNIHKSSIVPLGAESEWLDLNGNSVFTFAFEIEKLEDIARALWESNDCETKNVQVIIESPEKLSLPYMVENREIGVVRSLSRDSAPSENLKCFICFVNVMHVDMRKHIARHILKKDIKLLNPCG